MSNYIPPGDSMAVFCDSVKRTLRKLRISQNELASRVGMDSSALSKVINGKAGNCSLETCDRIAAGLGTTTADLLNGRD